MSTALQFKISEMFKITNQSRYTFWVPDSLQLTLWVCTLGMGDEYYVTTNLFADQQT